MAEQHLPPPPLLHLAILRLHGPAQPLSQPYPLTHFQPPCFISNALTPFLELTDPTRFGKVYLGEPLRTCVLIQNMSEKASLRNISIQVSMRNRKAAKKVLCEHQIQTLEPKEMEHVVISRMISDLATHHLVAVVKYIDQFGARHAIDRTVKIQPERAIKCSTSIHAQMGRTIVSINVLNTSDELLHVHDVQFLAEEMFHVESLNLPNSFGSLNPDQASLFHFSVFQKVEEEEDEKKHDISLTGLSLDLGQFEVRWKRASHELGRLMTPMLKQIIQKTNVGALLRVVDCPSRVIVEDKFSFRLEIRNVRERASRYCVRFPNNNASIAVIGETTIQVGRLEGGEHCILELTGIGTEVGIHSIGPILVTEVSHKSESEHPFTDLCELLVVESIYHYKLGRV